MANRPKPAFKKVKQDQELKESGVTMNDLPELPLEKVFSYMSLKERLKARLVSRRWCKMIDGFRVQSLCFSDRPSGFIYPKSRWVSGSFVHNFIDSAKFDLFFQTFGSSTLSNLKHLRLCDLRLTSQTEPVFARVVSSFNQLKKLDLMQFRYLHGFSPRISLRLNLQALNSISLEDLNGIDRLTLDAPRLKNAKICDSPLRVDLVRDDGLESVERLVIDHLGKIEVENMKNLKYLCVRYFPKIEDTFLSGLKQLSQIHLYDNYVIFKLFEQKARYGRVDLEIFFRGLLLNGPNDPDLALLTNSFQGAALTCLAENPSRLATGIPFCVALDYTEIERVVPQGAEIGLLKRYTDLKAIIVRRPIQDFERFLDLLNNLHSIAHLHFECDLPQELFDRLSDHCTSLQYLTIIGELSDFHFLFKLTHLNYLHLLVPNLIDAKIIRQVLQNLPFLLNLDLEDSYKRVKIEVDLSKQFKVSVNGKFANNVDTIRVTNLDAVIQFIFKKEEDE